MFTKLGKTLLGITIPSWLPAQSTDQNCVIAAKNYAGTDLYFRNYLPSQSANLLTSNTYGSGIAFGTGTTSSTEDDYTMESLITSGISATVTTQNAYDSTNYKYTTYYQYTVNNTGSSDVVISEIGRFVNGYTSSTRGGTSSSSTTSFLVDHIILDEPVTIPAGEAAVIRYSVELPNGDVE